MVVRDGFSKEEVMSFLWVLMTKQWVGNRRRGFYVEIWGNVV